MKRMTESELHLVHIARALIMNPEVLVMQRPLLKYSKPMEKNVMDVMNRHCLEHGLGLSATYRHQRRPRSVFFTADNISQLGAVDNTWLIEPVGKGTIPCKVIDVNADDPRIGALFHRLAPVVDWSKAV